MYSFNEDLFKRLPSVLGILQKELSLIVFGNEYKYSRRLDDMENFTFYELVDVCNKLHISLTDFIFVGEQPPIILDKQKYVISKDTFLPVQFFPENIRRLYGKKGMIPNLTRPQLAEILGITGNTLTSWGTSGNSYISVYNLLAICNRYCIDLDVFATDPNKALPIIKEKEESVELTPKIWQELTDLQNKEKELRAKVESLTHENARLKLSLQTCSHLEESSVAYSSPENKPGKRKWIAHWRLLTSLHRIFNMSRKEMLAPAGIKNVSASFNEGDITIWALIKVCNHWHISTRHIFLHDTGIAPSIYNKDYYLSEEWKPIEFHPENIDDLYGKDSLTGLNKEELAQTESLSEWKIRAWRMPKSSMRISDLVRMCNELDITPSCFITDRNRTELSYPMTYTEFLIEENRALRQKILRMKKEKNVKALPPIP